LIQKENMMKMLTLFGALLFGLIAVQAANAYDKVRPNETYCLETSMGPGGSAGPIMCEYETMEQCFASKASKGDICELNPILAFERQDARRRGR
jgi:hypothetical protein